MSAGEFEGVRLGWRLTPNPRMVIYVIGAPAVAVLWWEIDPWVAAGLGLLLGALMAWWFSALLSLVYLNGRRDELDRTPFPEPLAAEANQKEDSHA